MKAVIMNGSPRKKGAGVMVLEEIKKGLAASGTEYVEYHLNSMNYRGCQGCLFCQKTGKGCCQKDDLVKAYKDIQEADGIIFSSPVYMYAVSGQTKLWMDRMYPFVDLRHNARFGEKRLMSVYCQAHPDVNAYQSEMERVKNALSELEWIESQRLVVSGIAPVLNPVVVNEEILKEAYEAGRTFLKPS